MKMKTLAAIFTLAATVLAQDLDAPRVGVQVPMPPPSVYDALLARMATIERNAIAAEALNPHHSEGWRLWLGYYDNLTNEITALKPIEREFFRAEVYEAFNRLIAAGLN